MYQRCHHYVPDDSRGDPLLLFFSSPHPPAGPHGVGLAGPCLSVREYCSIVATEAAVHQLRHTVVVHLLLQITITVTVKVTVTVTVTVRVTISVAATGTVTVTKG